MAANQPSGAVRGGLRLPGWRVLLVLWVALGAAIGTTVIWAEMNATRPATTAEAPSDPPPRSRDGTIFTAAIPPEARSGPGRGAEPPPADPAPAAAPSSGLPQANGSSGEVAVPAPSPPKPTVAAAPAPEPEAPAPAPTNGQAPVGPPPSTNGTPAPAVAVVSPPPVLSSEYPALPVAGAAIAAPVAPPPAVPAQTQSAAIVPPPPPPPTASGTAPSAPVARPSTSGLAEPDPALLEPSRHGMLPRRGADGRMPYLVYAQPYRRADSRSRIGLIVADSGAYGAYSEDALRRLPPQVAIAISPYAPHAETMAARARERGMETLIALPLEPAGFPLNDPGQRALLTIRSAAENADNLDWVLSRFHGYVGVVGALGPMRGERFAHLPDSLRRVHDTLRERGLLYIDPRPGTPTTDRVWGRTVDIVLDEPPMRNEIERRLAEIDTIARLRGSALGYAGTLSPTLLDRLVAWAAGLEARGLTLVPISAMLRVRQPVDTDPAVSVSR